MTKIQDAHYIDQLKGKSSGAESDGLNYLEQLTALAVDCCPNSKTPVIAGSDAETKSAFFYRPGCKTWACPVCGPRNGKRWIARLLHGMTKVGGAWSFVTLTAHQKWRGEASLKNIRSNWHKLRKRMRRAIPHELFYVWVYERHKDKSWHVHMLYNAHLTTRWWKDNAAACGLGYQAKDEPLDNYGQAAGYVAKYLLKQMTLIPPYPTHMRRITVSRNFPQLPEQDAKEDGMLWRLMNDRKHMETYADFLRRMGYEVRGIHQVRKALDRVWGPEYPF